MTHYSPSDSMRIQSMELLAYAVLDLFPTTLLVKGKVSNIDFIYDFIFEKPLTDQAIPLIEERWRKVLKEFEGFETREMMRENAAGLFQHHHQPIKAEAALAEESNIVSLIQLNRFYDLMPIGLGPAFEERVYPKVFSYFTFRQDELLITRLEAAAFSDQAELKNYQKIRKQKEKLNHQVLAKELDLFTCDQGDWCFYPRGETLKKCITETVLEECRNSGFFPVSFSNDELPALPNLDAFGINGIAVWKKEEQEGDINKGLLEASVYNVLQIFVSNAEKILYESCISSLHFIQQIIKIFDLNHEWVLRYYRPKEVVKKKWQSQVDLLKSAAEQCNIIYCSDPSPDNLSLEDSYPKMELSVFDALGRRWATSAISFSNCGNKEVLVVSPLVSLERFVALLLEQTAGKIPGWLQPEQARVLPVAKEFKETARAMQKVLSSRDIRTGLDIGFEKLAERIRLGVQHQIPYLLMVGDEEEKNGLVAVRRFGEDQVSKMSLEEFILIAKQELKTKLES